MKRNSSAPSRVRSLPAAAPLDALSVPAIVTATLLGFDDEGHPLLQIPRRSTPVRAQTVIPLNPTHAGARVVYGCEDGDPERPIITGVLLSLARQAEPPPQVDVSLDGNRLVLSAAREIVLRCGKASLVLSADGNVRVHGENVASTATGKQRIRGATVKIN